VANFHFAVATSEVGDIADKILALSAGSLFTQKH
jgi:hypothetical protein